MPLPQIACLTESLRKCHGNLCFSEIGSWSPRRSSRAGTPWECGNPVEQLCGLLRGLLRRKAERGRVTDGIFADSPFYPFFVGPRVPPQDSDPARNSLPPRGGQSSLRGGPPLASLPQEADKVIPRCFSLISFSQLHPSLQAPQRGFGDYPGRALLGVSPDFHRVFREAHGRPRLWRT